MPGPTGPEPMSPERRKQVEAMRDSYLHSYGPGNSTWAVLADSLIELDRQSSELAAARAEVARLLSFLERAAAQEPATDYSSGWRVCAREALAVARGEKGGA